MLNEIAVVSGKGGTGKTTLVASLLAYTKDVVVADCDVDAPDLHLLLRGKTVLERDFSGLQRPVFNTSSCIECGMCKNHCKFDAIDETFRLIEGKCEGCGVCAYVCPESAIEMKDSVIGRISHRKIDKGDFIYGQLIPGEETSGKLVSEVRRLAKKVADQRAIQSILIDGAPGIACNVIASVTGVKHVIIVTEPTISGLHDLERVYELVSRFRVKVTVVINKSDLSVKGLEAIRDYCLKNSIAIGLEIPFNKEIVASISELKLPADVLNNFYEKIGFKAFVQSLNLL